jgi:pimeloyl-ACP methyl ester carboxylesterase
MELNSFWRGTNANSIHEAESEVLKLSGLPEEYFKSYKVDIEFGQADYIENGEAWKEEDICYIWTYEIGEKSDEKPTIVLVHGYGGSGLIFYRLYTQLYEHYHVVFLDLLGMGRSARPPFRANSTEEAENFFVNSLEKWREKMGLDDMILCGHSFGGFVVGRYGAKYTNRVKKIVFLSSLGKQSFYQGTLTFLDIDFPKLF